MKRILFVILLFFTCSAIAQTPDTAKGEFIIKVFSNFHTGFGAANNDRGFAMDRSYFGYQYSVGNGLSFKAVMDVGQSSNVNDLQRIAFIKNAQVSWKKERLTLHGGLISTTSFKVQEDFWGYRYMKMVLQDYYKFASSADLGLSAAYKFADWISGDVIVVNGEGYKKLQVNDGLQYGAGLTIKPIKNLTLRLYGSLNEGGNDNAEDIGIYAFFAGYKHEKFSLGAEWNMMQNAKNVTDANLEGVSVYSTVKLSGMVNAFARYDNIWSKNDWNISKDESTYMAGVEIRPCQYIKIAPNFRYHDAKSPMVKDTYYLYLSCFFGF
ncbi:MAG: hypothetical protein II299_04130 [Alistipes sp.]|nr:hypothetical protein [Alistipes sp.]